MYWNTAAVFIHCPRSASLIRKTKPPMSVSLSCRCLPLRRKSKRRARISPGWCPLTLPSVCRPHTSAHRTKRSCATSSARNRSTSPTVTSCTAFWSAMCSATRRHLQRRPWCWANWQRCRVRWFWMWAASRRTICCWRMAVPTCLPVTRWKTAWFCCITASALKPTPI